ncbi:peptidylprolyl isomerase [Calothrix sp. 336/3]|uniref:peptidylprolyl isomerase n=1 Tax=Calothrix sp. 336/3 TaxID=1337936 RepID=UPI0004E34E89|nr:peptidylprolyl isomerase [Calothrix sp. 336/3]AKG21029.1 peptidylprolyl isomerase [Calothrix sp. 336/3]
MTHSIQIGNRSVNATEIIPLLIRHQMLPQLRRILIIDEAIASIEITPEEQENVIKQFFHQMTTPTARSAVMKHYGMTEEELPEVAIREFKLEKFKQLTFGSKVESTFLTQKSKFDKVIYSLIRTENAEIAQELYYRIKAGEQSFAECAKSYSAGVEAQTGGLIGPVPLSQPHPLLAQKLTSSQPGQLWQPMRLENWFIILRLEKLIPAQLDETMRNQLQNRLFETWLTQEMGKVQITVQNLQK